MITEKEYLKAKKLVDDYERQLSQAAVSGAVCLNEKAISRAKRRFDFWCGCIVWHRPKEYSYFKVCSVCDRRQTYR
jgi:hypothetical protein